MIKSRYKQTILLLSLAFPRTPFPSVCTAGVSWALLHEMDYLKYISVRRDYIVLPQGSLTNATRLRWWQPFTISSGLASPTLERAQWAIDNILVGGSDINPSMLLDTFDDGRVFSIRCQVLRRLLLL